MAGKAMAMMVLLATIHGLTLGQQPQGAAAPGLPAASSPATQVAPRGPGGRNLKVLCSVFPVYLFTRNIAAGSNLQVEPMLPPAMGCPHDYSLTPRDMQKIAAASILIVNGLGLEEFIGEPVKKANPGIQIIDASAGIKDLIRTEPDDDDHEGKESPAAGGHGVGEGHRHGAANPHIFASPRTAAQMVKTIADELAKVDAENARLYADNAAAYIASLNELRDEFAAAGKKFKSRAIVTEHAVFDYLARDCGLTIVAVVEESPGQAPSAAGMLALVRKIKDSGAAAVFTEPQYPARVSQTIAAEAKTPVAVLDPVASGPEGAGLDYYQKAMRKNLEILTAVLGRK